MQELLGQLSIRINDKLYLKDPDSSDLGRRIIQHSIELIDEIGFEKFTFKKLGARIHSPESTVYRYFENKHKLLIYLTSWYWGWMEYKLVFSTVNIEDPVEQLKKAIQIVTEPVVEDSSFSHINEVRLYRIVISESTKAIFTKNVDEENKEGYFSGYKRLVNRISNMVQAVDPNFPFSHTLVSTLIEGTHQQKFFSEHMPSLTDIRQDDADIHRFFMGLTFSMLKHNE